MVNKGRRKRDERGYLMAALMAFVAISGILSVVALQEYAEVLRRDNEAEMMFRAQEIVRAIQRYRVDHGGVAPLEMEQLMEAGPRGNYYLRRQYTDPLSADGKWGLLFVGPGNQIIDPHADEQAGLAGQAAQGLGAFNRGQRGGLAGRNGGGGGSGGSGSGSGSGDGSGGSGGGGNSNRPFGNNRGGLGSGGGGQGESTGLPIAGVRTLSDDRPFRVYNGLTDYSQWLFTYFDLENQQLPGQRGRGPGGNSPGGPGNTGNVNNPGATQPPGSKKP